MRCVWILLVLVQCGRPTNMPDVLIVTLDTTRADHMGYAGYSGAHTPFLDHFAKSAVVFDQAVTVAPITLPSHTTIMTGTYPIFHGVHDNDGYRVDDQLTTLAEVFLQHGYQTSAVVGSFPLVSQFNLSQGFDHYDDAFETQAHDVGDPPEFGFVERNADKVVERFNAWFSNRKDKPYFAWVHFFDPHQDYRPLPPFDTQFAASPYDGEIATMDRAFGELLRIVDQGTDSPPIIIVVGDHGEGLAEHEEYTHAPLVYDSTMLVPLMIRTTKVTPCRVSSQVSTVDLAPTLLELVNLPALSDAQGTSLVPAARTGSLLSDKPTIIESEYAYLNHGWAPLIGVRVNGWKLIHGPYDELFDLKQDPGETHNLIASHPAKAAELSTLLADMYQANIHMHRDRSSVSELDSASIEKLQSLGYVASSSITTRSSYPDPMALTNMKHPRDAIHLMNKKSIISESLRLRHFEKAVRTSMDWLALDPDNPSALTMLGHAYMGLGQWSDAYNAYELALTFRPDDSDLHARLGRIHFLTGQFRKAISRFEVSIELNPYDLEVQLMLGATQAEIGEHQRAIDTLTRLKAKDPKNWRVLYDLAQVQEKGGFLNQALENYQQASRVNPGSDLAMFKCGTMARLIGDHKLARRYLENALFLNPNLVDAHLQISELLIQGDLELELAQEHLIRVLNLNPDDLQRKKARQLLESI
ncbi:MAG: sulfatase-like hydrolase/transferase [Acidobacteria bacterium]|nr:sulfatase-like hydrolase/transferase [Acidobacteriota bacterium]